MDNLDICKEVTGIISDELNVHPSLISENSGPYLGPPEWDSMGHLQIFIKIEEHYGIKFDIEEIEKIKTLKDIQNLVLTKIS